MSPYCSVYFVISLQFIFYITFKFWYTVPQVFKICYLFNNIIIYHNFYPLYVVPPHCHWFSFCAGYGHFVQVNICVWNFALSVTRRCFNVVAFFSASVQEMPLGGWNTKKDRNWTWHVTVWSALLGLTQDWQGHKYRADKQRTAITPLYVCWSRRKHTLNL